MRVGEEEEKEATPLPSPFAVLPEIVQLVSVGEERSQTIAPPLAYVPVAVLPEIVQWVSVGEEEEQYTPAPRPEW